MRANSRSARVAMLTMLFVGMIGEGLATAMPSKPPGDPGWIWEWLMRSIADILAALAAP